MTMYRLTLGSPGVASPGLAVPAASASPRQAGLRLLLDGVDLMPLPRVIRAGTLRVRQVVDGRATLEYRHQVIGGGQHLQRGQRVQLRLDGVAVFAGVIEGFAESKFDGSPSLGILVRAVDLWGILERRQVDADEEYLGQTAGFIVRDLVTTYAAGEGLTTNSVEDGPVLDAFTVKAYTRSVAAAIREVAARADMISGLDANRDVVLQMRTAQPAAVALADAGAWNIDGDFGEGAFGFGPFGQAADIEPMLALEGTVVREAAMEGYRNRQTIRYGADLTPVTVEDTTEQALRAALEGGTGIYHVVEDRPDIETEAEALEAAQARLRRHRLADVLRFDTRNRSLRPGQLLPVSLPAHGLAGQFLVRETTIQDEGARMLRWTAVITSGEPVDVVGAYYRRLQAEAEA